MSSSAFVSAQGSQGIQGVTGLGAQGQTGAPGVASYGEMTLDNPSGITGITMTNASQYYVINNGPWIAGNNSGFTFNSPGTLTAGMTGTYITTCALSPEINSTNQDLIFQIFQNGNPITDHIQQVRVSNAAEVSPVTISGVVAGVNAGDVFDVRVQNITSGGKICTVLYGNFNMEAVAGSQGIQGVTGLVGITGIAGQVIAVIGATGQGVTGIVGTNASSGTLFRYQLLSNITLQNPTGAVDGQLITWELIQGYSGSNVMTTDSNFAYGTDLTGVTLTTTLGKRDFMSARYNITTGKYYVVGFIRGY